MSGNRDELPRPTDDGPEGSPRSQQRQARDEIAEKLGIDPSLIGTRDTLDRGIQQRLTDEGATAAERSAAQRVAEQAGFIERDDVRANVDPETFAVEQRLTDEGTTEAEQRLAQGVAEQADFIETDDVAADVDPETFEANRQLTEEGTSEAEQRLAEQTAADQEFVRPGDLEADVDPETFTAEASLTESGREAAQQRQAEQLRSEAAQQSDRFGESDFRVDRSGDEITVEPTESAVDRERREQAAQQFESQSRFINNVSPQDVNLSGDSAELDDSIIEQAEARAQRQASQQASQQRQEARQDFAQSIESGSAFGDLPDGVDPASLVDNIDPQQDIVREGDSLALSDDVQGRINSQLESDAVQQQRQEFAQALESGEAFESGEAPDALGSVDPQTDVAVEDGSLTLADDTQADLIESQIRAQAGATPGLNTDDVLQRAASQDQILRAVEEQIETQTGTDTRSGLIEDANLTVNADGTIEADRVLLNSRRFDDFRDVSSLPDDLIGDANLSVDATEQFRGQIEQNIAQQISERNVVDVSPDQIDISGGNVSVGTPSSLTIENDQITADGLSESGQDDFARRQLQSIETTEGISVATPIDSQPFANVSARLAEAAEGGGSLSSATRIVAASETVDNIGDLDNMADTRIIAGLEPDQAEERLGIDADTVEEAQRDIRVNQIELNNDPEAVLQDIAANQDEFVNDSTRIGVAGERGQRIRQAARTQINQLEQQIAAGDDDVAPGDVGLTLTDDLSGIRSIDEGGRQAIAQSVDEQLPNFDSSEVNVGVSDGQITTSIEDSVRERFVENAQRVQEIQVRNEIADETEGIGRRDIEVNAGEGVSPSDELVTETLGADVDADIESFDQLQQAANIQARQQARQQAIQQANSQTIGAVDPRDVSVERTGDGFTASVSGAAADPVDLSPADATAIDPGVENQSPQISDPIRAFEGGLRDVGAGLDETLGSAGRTVGSTLADVNIGVQAAQQATDSDIGDRFFEEAGAGGARALNPATFAAEGVQAADILARGPDREFGFEDLPGAADAAALQAGAEGDLDADLPQTSEDFVVEAGEQDAAQLSQSFESDPVGTTGQLTGGIITGSIAGTALTRGAFRVGRSGGDVDVIDNRPDLGTGGTGSLFDADTIDAFRAGDRGQLDLTSRQRGRDVTEPEINDERLSQNLRQQTITRRQRKLREATEGGTFEGEVDPVEGIGERARREADVGDIRDRTQDIDVDTRSLTAEGGALGGVLADQEPEVAFDDDTPTLEPGGELADTVDTGVTTTFEGQFRQEIGTTGEQRFFERGRNDVVTGEDIDTGVGADVGAEPGVDVGARPGADVGVGARPREDVDTGGGVSPRSGIDTDQRQDTDLTPRQDTGVDAPRVTGREIGVNREVGAPRTTDVDIPRFNTPEPPRPDFPNTPEAEPRDEEQVFGLQSTDDLFDSEILSGEEALEQSFGSDGDTDNRFTL